jgi:hypothetical protein
MMPLSSKKSGRHSWGASPVNRSLHNQTDPLPPSATSAVSAKARTSGGGKAKQADSERGEVGFDHFVPLLAFVFARKRQIPLGDGFPRGGRVRADETLRSAIERSARGLSRLPAAALAASVMSVLVGGRGLPYRQPVKPLHLVGTASLRFVMIDKDAPNFKHGGSTIPYNGSGRVPEGAIDTQGRRR